MKSNIAIFSGVKRVNADVAKMLADELEMLVLDTDDYIAYDIEMSINQLIDDQGGDFFYTVETAKLQRMKEYVNAVIATSPTCLVNLDNVRNIKQFCFVVQLTCDPDVEYNRFHRDTTLVMKNHLAKKYGVVLENQKKLEEEGLADIRVDTTGKRPRQIVNEITNQLQKLFG